jgi:hypothetical protein
VIGGDDGGELGGLEATLGERGHDSLGGDDAGRAHDDLAPRGQVGARGDRARAASEAMADKGTALMVSRAPSLRIPELAGPLRAAPLLHVP